MTPRNPALHDRVASIAVIAQRGAHTVLPAAGAVLGLQHRGRVRAGAELLSTAGVTGIQPVAREYDYVGETASILVRFTPQGAACLGVPASELAGRSVALDDLLPGVQVRALRERLLEARTDAARVDLVEELLLALPYARDALVDRAVELLSRSIHVASVARALSISERQLERRFLQRVGLTPKRFATLRRFERAVAIAQRAPSLASAAIDAGYCDQSHFIRDFRRYAGTTPRDFLRHPP